MLHVQKFAKSLLSSGIKGSTASLALVWPYNDLRAIKQIQKATNESPSFVGDYPLQYAETNKRYSELLKANPHSAVYGSAPCYACLSYWPRQRVPYTTPLKALKELANGKLDGSIKLVEQLLEKKNTVPEYVVFMPKFFVGFGLNGLKTDDFGVAWDKMTHNQKKIEEYYNIILKNWKWVTAGTVGTQTFRGHVEEGFIVKTNRSLQRLFAQGMIPRHFAEHMANVLEVVPGLVKKGFTRDQAVMLSFAVSGFRGGDVMVYRGGGHGFWHADYATDEAYLSLLDGSYEPKWTQKKNWEDTKSMYPEFDLHKCTTHAPALDGKEKSKFIVKKGEGWDTYRVLDVEALKKAYNER